ncbi:MAG: hypothetical protein KF764_25545 [Labilithrix sp.]|nr:hypothetical protein [Labilithrix sp.]
MVQTSPTVMSSSDELSRSSATLTSGQTTKGEVGDLLPLDEKALAERLAINSPELVQELFTLVQGLVTAEVGRQTRLDAKATSLLTAAGLSLTVTTGFASTVLARPDLVKDWNPAVLFLASLAFLVATVVGLLAAIWAVRALRVRGDYRAANESSLFDAELLLEANDPPSMADEKDDAQRRLFGLMEYRKHLIPHYWAILRAHRLVHGKKADIVGDGQTLFLAFLGAVLLVCVLVGVGVYWR